jgi:hypothetical protein
MLKQQRKYFFELHVCCDWRYFDLHQGATSKPKCGWSPDGDVCSHTVLI